MRRYPTIDLLRGLSILAVILLHTWIYFRGRGLHLDRYVPHALAHLTFFNGGNGVTLFFAISGFLITTTSLHRFGQLDRIHPGIFYRIRFARIAPLLLLLLAILAALHLLHVEGFVIDKPHASLAGALLSALTFTLNWYETAHMHGWLPACWTVLWSLSIEEMFYLFFPLTCLALMRRRHGFTLFAVLLIGLAIAGCFARTVWAHGDELAQENSYLSGMAHIACGVLTALIAWSLARRTRPPSPVLLTLAQATGTAIILLYAVYPSWLWIRPFLRLTGVSGTDDLLLALGTCLVMAASVLRNRPQHRITAALTAPLRWFGRHSYELYLFHEFVVILLVKAFFRLQITHNPGSPLAWAAAIVLACAPLAWLLARFFSEPLNRHLRPNKLSHVN